MAQEQEMNLLERIQLQRKLQEEARARFEAAFEAAKALDISQRWRMFDGREVSGKRLRELGYAFFDEERDYSLSLGEDGVVQVSSWRETEGPDSDGFGMEECYDWWLLDECLEKFPDVDWLCSYSRGDFRIPSVAKRWAAQREKAAAIVRARKAHAT